MGTLHTRLAVAIKKLISAEIDNSWKGGGDPDDFPKIKKDLLTAQLKVGKLLVEVAALELKKV